MELFKFIPHGRWLAVKYKKIFDCVEMKEQAQEVIQKKIYGLTLDQKLQYWKESSSKMKKKFPKLKTAIPTN